MFLPSPGALSAAYMYNPSGPRFPLQAAEPGKYSGIHEYPRAARVHQVKKNPRPRVRWAMEKYCLSSLCLTKVAQDFSTLSLSLASWLDRDFKKLFRLFTRDFFVTLKFSFFFFYWRLSFLLVVFKFFME